MIKIGRILWQSLSKVFGPSSFATSQQKAVQTLYKPVQKTLLQRFLRRPYSLLRNNNIAYQFAKLSWQRYIERSRRGFFLVSFVGIYLKESNEAPKKPSLCTLSKHLQCELITRSQEIKSLKTFPSKITEYEIVTRLGKPSSYGAVYHARHNNNDVAIKMMFNLHKDERSSNQETILRTFHQEFDFMNCNKDDSIKNHPNIINIKGKFVDNTNIMYDSTESYPLYVPRQVNQNSFGCSKTLYLVMPKFSCSLRDYLQENTQISFKERLNLLCQLLEGVSCLVKNNIAHRDLKSDNILIENTNASSYPNLVITDFGSCFKGDEDGMLLPFGSEFVDKGGNPALMAPEISNAKPGNGVYLDYQKSDVWAVGAIAFEIFGKENPCYSSNQTKELRHLLNSGDWFVDAIVNNMLQVDPVKRLSANDASTLLCLLFFDVVKWWKHLNKVERWFLEMLFAIRRNKDLFVEDKKTELFKTFARRVSPEEVFNTIEKIPEMMFEHKPKKGTGL